MYAEKEDQRRPFSSAVSPQDRKRPNQSNLLFTSPVRVSNIVIDKTLTEVKFTKSSQRATKPSPFKSGKKTTAPVILAQ